MIRSTLKILDKLNLLKQNEDMRKKMIDELQQIVKVAKIVKARDYWIFLVAQHEMSCLEMDEQGLLGI